MKHYKYEFYHAGERIHRTNDLDEASKVCGLLTRAESTFSMRWDGLWFDLYENGYQRKGPLKEFTKRLLWPEVYKHPVTREDEHV